MFGGGYPRAPPLLYESLSVEVKSPLEKLGTPILTLGGVRGRLGGVVRVGGNWLGLTMLQLILVVWCISESGNHCVSVFTSEGQFVTILS